MDDRLIIGSSVPVGPNFALQRDLLECKAGVKELRASTLRAIHSEKWLLQRDGERIARVVGAFLAQTKAKHEGEVAGLRKAQEALKTRLADEYDLISANFDEAEAARKEGSSGLATALGKELLGGLVETHRTANAAVRAVQAKAGDLISREKEAARMANAAAAFVSASLEHTRQRLAQTEEQLALVGKEKEEAAVEAKAKEQALQQALAESMAREAQLDKETTMLKEQLASREKEMATLALQHSEAQGRNEVLSQALIHLAASFESLDTSITTDVRIGLHGLHAKITEAVMGASRADDEGEGADNDNHAAAIDTTTDDAGAGKEDPIVGSIVALAHESLQKTQLLLARGVQGMATPSNSALQEEGANAATTTDPAARGLHFEDDQSSEGEGEGKKHRASSLDSALAAVRGRLDSATAFLRSKEAAAFDPIDNHNDNGNGNGNGNNEEEQEAAADATKC